MATQYMEMCLSDIVYVLRLIRGGRTGSIRPLASEPSKHPYKSPAHTPTPGPREGRNVSRSQEIQCMHAT